ncbi:hypothetical protein EV175_001973 [Coemansia sp. RSA 1933]|nr:hypothetical protein EV175_001973 [Coemansia sp. RSA 1933]
MNSEFPGYDGTNTTPATNDTTFNHMHSIAASFSGVPEDYEGYDNARARKRRMTASDGRRASDSFSGFSLPDVSNGLLSMLDHHQQQQQGYSSSSAGNMLQAAGLSSLPVPPDSGNSSLGTARLSATYPNTGGFDGMSSSSSSSQTNSNILGSPSLSGRAAAAANGGRKHQSLSISVGRNE